MISTWMHVLLLVWCPYVPSNCIRSLPHSIWNARHAWTFALTLYSIMILHLHECEPMKSAHWACKHDVCSSFATSTTVSRHRFMSAIRYVKVSCKFINPPKHGSYGRLEEDKRVCLKTNSICHHPRSWLQHLFEILAKTAEKHDVINVVRLSLRCAAHVGCLLSSLWPLPWPSPPY